MEIRLPPPELVIGYREEFASAYKESYSADEKEFNALMECICIGYLFLLQEYLDKQKTPKKIPLCPN